MTHLLDEGKFVNVEMTVEGELIKAHRLVLCASSQVFEVRQYLFYHSPVFICLLIILYFTGAVQQAERNSRNGYGRRQGYGH